MEEKNKTIKIYATCPECGNDEWIHADNGEFKCSACGAIVAPENMCLTAEDDNL
jgi:ribosomal protein S27E